MALATNAAIFMARALLPKRRGAGLPRLALRLPPARPPAGDLAWYLRLTGLASGDTLPLAWPLVWGFRLHMALLTHPEFPLPIWSALQVRNRIQQHSPLPAVARYALAVETHGMRGLEKGVEVDIVCALYDESGRLAWQSLATFYWRGRLRAAVIALPPQAASPTVEGEVVASWDSGEGAGWRFGTLTGDYNPLHWNDRYARLLGFARAFHHPARIAGQCLAHLAIDAGAAPRQQLELWMKGPVFYRSALALRAGADGDARLFALHVDGDVRPALVGRTS